MVQLGQNFDASQVDPVGEYAPLPDGDYNVMITASDYKETKSGNGHYVSLQMEVQGGEYHGRALWENLNIDNPNQQAVDIAYRTLSAICHAVGVLNVQDTEELHGRMFSVKYGKDKKGESRVLAYNPADSAPVQQPQQQTQQQQASAGGKPSWAR